MDPDLQKLLTDLDGRVSRLNDKVQELIDVTRSQNRPRVLRIRNTVPGQLGQVVPGETTYEGSDAEYMLKSFDTDHLLPLQNMPPWTHMAMGHGSWWLVEMSR